MRCAPYGVMLIAVAGLLGSCEVYPEGLLLDAEEEQPRGPRAASEGTSTEPVLGVGSSVSGPRQDVDGGSKDDSKEDPSVPVGPDPSQIPTATTPPEERPDAPQMDGGGGASGSNSSDEPTEGSGGTGSGVQQADEPAAGGAGGESSAAGGSAGQGVTGAGEDDATGSGGANAEPMASAESDGAEGDGAAGASGGATDAGAGGSDGDVPPMQPEDSSRWGFASDVEGWILGVSQPTGLSGQSTLAFDDGEGEPVAGCLRVQVAFNGPNQQLAVQVPMASTDLSGQTLSAQVYLKQGLSQDSANPSHIKLFVKSGTSYVFASGAAIDLQPGGDWVSVSFDVNQPAYVDPAGNFNASDVREVGFELSSGSAGSVSSGVVYLDSVSW